MTSKSKRVSVGFTDREHAALQAMATHQRIAVSTVIARIARAHLATGHPQLPDQIDPRPAPATPPANTPSLTSRPPWLPPLAKAAHQDWVHARAAAVQALIDRYPAELGALEDRWAKDAAVREQLWALSVWRDLLDTGTYDDPRMELAFANALTDFATYLQERPRTLLARQRR